MLFVSQSKREREMRKCALLNGTETVAVRYVELLRCWEGSIKMRNRTARWYIEFNLNGKYDIRRKRNIYDDEDVKIRHVKDTSGKKQWNSRALCWHAAKHIDIVLYCVQSDNQIHRETHRKTSRESDVSDSATKRWCLLLIVDFGQLRSVPLSSHSLSVCVFVFVYRSHMSVPMKCFCDHATNLVYTPTNLELCHFLCFHHFTIWSDIKSKRISLPFVCVFISVLFVSCHQIRHAPSNGIDFWWYFMYTRQMNRITGVNIRICS